MDLNSSFSSAGPNVNANLFDENRNKLELRIIPDQNLSGGLLGVSFILKNLRLMK